MLVRLVVHGTSTMHNLAFAQTYHQYMVPPSRPPDSKGRSSIEAKTCIRRAQREQQMADYEAESSMQVLAGVFTAKKHSRETIRASIDGRTENRVRVSTPGGKMLKDRFDHGIAKAGECQRESHDILF